MKYITTITRTDKSIIRMHRPILTEEERAKRMKAIEEAAAELILATMIAKRERSLSQDKPEDLSE